MLALKYTYTCESMCLKAHPLRTNLVLDDERLEEAMRYTSITTKKGVIEEALRTLVRLKASWIIF